MHFWPVAQSDQIFSIATYNYLEDKQLWNEFLCKDNTSGTYTSLVKFGFVRSYLMFDIPNWFFYWWNTFGINRRAVDPYIIEHEYDAHVVALENIRDMQDKEVMD